MDIFVEQLVRAAYSPKRVFLRVLFIFLCVGAGIAIMLFTPLQFFAFTLLIMIGFIWLAWYLAGTQSIEYEYILTNAELDIDKITAKRSRKRLISIKVTTFTDWKIADTSGEKPHSGADVRVIDVSGRQGDVYIAECSHNTLGRIQLRFTPNADFTENIEKVFPRELKLKLRQNRTKNV